MMCQFKSCSHVYDEESNILALVHENESYVQRNFADLRSQSVY